MPKYRAIQPGFIHGRLYGPNTKRPVVTTDKPLKPVPSWLEVISEKVETAAEKKKRLAAEKAAAEAAAKEAEKDRSEVVGTSFLDEGGTPTVETL